MHISRFAPFENVAYFADPYGIAFLPADALFLGPSPVYGFQSRRGCQFPSGMMTIWLGTLLFFIQ
jgi:hypothetical protein